MIQKYNRIFTSNVNTYILNRLTTGVYQSMIVDEVMSRFPIWVGLFKCDSETQRAMVTWLVDGIAKGVEYGKINKGE